MPTVTDQDQLDVLRQVTATTLENFAFMFAEGIDDEPRSVPEDADYMTANVDFSGSSQSGNVLVAMPTALCQQMAADVLGMLPDDLPQNATRDVIQEWANIVGGALVAALFGMERTFTLSSPVATQIGASNIMELCNAPGTIALSVEEQLVLARLQIG